MPYHQFQIEKKGAKVKYSDQLRQMSPKDQGVEKSLIVYDLTPPGIKLQILLLCLHTFFKEVEGRSC